jgi:hypothetical protein
MQRPDDAEASADLTAVIRVFCPEESGRIDTFKEAVEKLKIRINNKVVSCSDYDIERSIEELPHGKRIRVWKCSIRTTIDHLFVDMISKSLRECPFDRHDMVLSIELTTLYISCKDGVTRKIRYRLLKPERMQPCAGISFKADFDKCEYIVDKEEKKSENNGVIYKEIYYPRSNCKIVLYREPEVLLLTVVFPLIALNLCSLGVWAIPTASFTDKYTLAITFLLTLFAFVGYARSQVPRSPEITVLDWLILGSVAQIGFCVVEAVTSRDYPNKAEKGAFYVILLIFPTALISMIVYHCVLYYRNRPRSYDASKDNYKCSEYIPQDWHFGNRKGDDFNLYNDSEQRAEKREVETLVSS